jgi:hypothetical protein
MIFKTRKELDNYCNQFIMNECNGCYLKGSPEGCFWKAGRTDLEDKINRAVEELKRPVLEGNIIEISTSLAETICKVSSILEDK